jgi:hypothetical protein
MLQFSPLCLELLHYASLFKCLYAECDYVEYHGALAEEKALEDIEDIADDIAVHFVNVNVSLNGHFLSLNKYCLLQICWKLDNLIKLFYLHL